MGKKKTKGKSGSSIKTMISEWRKQLLALSYEDFKRVVEMFNAWCDHEETPESKLSGFEDNASSRKWCVNHILSFDPVLAEGGLSDFMRSIPKKLKQEDGKGEFVRYYVEREHYGDAEKPAKLTMMERNAAIYIEGITAEGRRIIIKDMRKKYQQKRKEERGVSQLRNFTVHIAARMTSDENHSQPMDIVLELPVPNAETWDDAFTRA